METTKSKGSMKLKVLAHTLGLRGVHLKEIARRLNMDHGDLMKAIHFNEASKEESNKLIAFINTIDFPVKSKIHLAFLEARKTILAMPKDMPLRETAAWKFMQYMGTEKYQSLMNGDRQATQADLDKANEFIKTL